MEAYGGPRTGTEGPLQATSGTAARPKCPEMTEKQIVEIFLFDLPLACRNQNGFEWNLSEFVYSPMPSLAQFVGNSTSIMQG